MSEIFDESNMQNRLGEYVPEGETLAAGIHVVNKELHIFRYYQNCVPEGDKLYWLDDVEPKVLQATKSKFATDDLYIGITQNYFIVATCTPNTKFLYKFDFVDNSEPHELESTENFVNRDGIAPRIDLRDIGHIFKLSDITKCEFKKGMFGSVKCDLEFKDKSTFKLMFPKKAGLGNGMPHHEEFKEKIIAALTR
ncbi:MAG: hypothetical protein ACI4JT_10830 [Oscillospiraceae bacterium]